MPNTGTAQPRVSAAPSRWLSPPQIAKQLGIDPDKVIGWIRTGQLNAVNVASHVGGRPRYRISSESLENFLRLRSTSPEPKPIRRQKAAFTQKYYA
jgi:hypothetical protein